MNESAIRATEAWHEFVASMSDDNRRVMDAVGLREFTRRTFIDGYIAGMRAGSHYALSAIFPGDDDA